MNLKSFHLFFIYASIVLASGFGGWCVTHDRLLMGVASVGLAVALVGYVGYFARKAADAHL